ncbi:MAG: heme biosynthesis HemY N-terminal domain-containing protein, partial [Pseudomonadota bacterium]
MIRIILFIIAVVALTFGATQLIGISGETIIAFGELRINAPSWAIVMLLIFFSIAIVLTTLIISGLVRMPKAIARKGRESRREKGLIALTRGLEAVAAGDARDAQRHARIATRQLKNDASLTRLLTAQAAQLAGD